MDQSSLFSGTEVPRNNRRDSKTLHPWCKKKIANDIKNIGDYVEHTFGKHNLEADHMANVGAQEQENCCRQGTNTERWKAVKGFWDGSAEDNGKSGCGIVIKGVDRITISENCSAFGYWLPLWPPKWWVSVFLRASSISSHNKV